MHYEADEESVSARELARAERKKAAEAAKVARREERAKVKEEQSVAKAQAKAERAAQLWGFIQKGGEISGE